MKKLRTFTEQVNKVRAYRKEQGESGAATVTFAILLTPLFLALFGFAVDIAALQQNMSSLQTSADAASQSVISQSQNSYQSNRPGMSSATARSNFITYYDANRFVGSNSNGATSANVPLLKCQGTGVTGGTVKSGCGFKITSFQYSNSGALANGNNIAVSVQEKSGTMFVRMFGIKEFTYNINTTARLTQSFR